MSILDFRFNILDLRNLEFPNLKPKINKPKIKKRSKIKNLGGFSDCLPHYAIWNRSQFCRYLHMGLQSNFKTGFQTHSIKNPKKQFYPPFFTFFNPQPTT